MSTAPLTQSLKGARRLRDRLGDKVLFLLTLLAALAAIAIMVGIALKVFREAHLSFSEFGLGFLTGTTWDATNGVFGAGTFLYGTAVTCALALLIGGPFAIAIALFLSELAPRGVRGVVGRWSRCSPRSRASCSVSGGSSSWGRSWPTTSSLG